MLSTLIQKELKAIILSPKFTATFAVCSLLMLLSVYIGVREYKTAVKQYETINELTEQEIREKSSWHMMYNRTLREPDPMHIFVAGLSYDVGRKSVISSQSPVKLEHSIYSDDPIFAIFRFIDFAFIVQVVLSLFAILFTYDAINGERERGTLRLIFSNSIPRAKFIIAKCAGAWLGLVVPICIPIMLSILIVLLFDVPLTQVHWAKLMTLMALSLLFFTFFIVLGVMISAWTKRSNVSFMMALVVWIVFVLIIPRAGVLTAGQLVSVPRVAEIEGQREAYAKERWGTFYEEMEKRWEERQGSSCGSNEEIEDEKLWAYMEEDDSMHDAAMQDIEGFQVKLMDDLRHRKAAQERLAFTLSRFSPASAYQLGAMSIANSDIATKSRSEDAMNEYRTRFNDYVEKKQDEGGATGHVMITISSDDGMN
ncbi:MAG: ABC transporter permease subunit, partial [candidate division Zixibacteria bacterium]|nr:ABC transporter permease subunit [candidate division Zixibacteria bacterium]